MGEIAESSRPLLLDNNLLRLSTASDSAEEVFVMGEIAESSRPLLLDNASRLMLNKVVGLVLVFCVCDEDFMVVVVVVEKGFSD
jgi:hypothetical protein